MTRRSRHGSVPCLLRLAGVTIALMLPAVAAAGQGGPSTTAVASAAATASAGPADEQEAQTAPPKKPGDKLKIRWRSAALEYGRKTRIDFRARFRAETRASDAAIAKDTLDDLDIPRKRVGVDGQIMGALAFKLDRELSQTAVATQRIPASPWKDVYFDVTQLGEAQFRYGRFKMPFSLDETTGSLDLEFAYRSTTATLLAPSRAKGWMVHGDTFDRAFGYEYGVFTTDGSNSLARTSELRVNPGETTAWRVTSEPLHGLSSPLADVHIGYARTRGELPSGYSAIKGRTVLGAEFYNPQFYVLGRRERKGFEFAWRPGPASLKMESITLTEERKEGSVENTDLSPFQVKGWYVSGSYAITGENKVRGVNRPNHPLGQGGFGAVELAVRVERIAFGSIQTGIGSKSPRADILPSNTDRITAFSGNWFPNRWVKVQMTIFNEEFTDPSTLRKELRPTPKFGSRVLRIQFSI